MRHLASKLLCAGAVAASFAFAAPALAQTKWDMPVPYGDNNFHTANIVQFGEDIKTATDSAVEISVHPSGSLYKHPDIKNAVRQGLVSIGEILGSRLSNEDPVFE
jgi:TRAP-type C4-dicarboxylate transport system substrate-binding protein